MKSTGAAGKGGTVIRVTTQTHNIILYTGAILTFGRLRDLCGLQRFGFLYEEIRVRESMMIEHWPCGGDTHLLLQLSSLPPRLHGLRGSLRDETGRL